MAVEMTTERALAATPPPAAANRLKAAFDTLTTNRTSGFLLVLALLGLWEVSARLHWVSSQSWPAFSAVLMATWHGLRSGELLGILGSTLARMFAGYFIGCGCGIAVGLLLGTVRTLDRLVTPLTEALRPLPIPAIVPPLILFLGLDDALKVFVVAFSVFFPVLVSTVGGVRGIDEVLLSTARTFGTSAWRKLTRVVLPAAAPAILAGLRIALSLALITTVVAEMIAGSAGVGHFILITQYALRPDEMYAAVLCLAVVGYLLNRGFILLERKALHWYVLKPH
jgi:ABC-type nitrate/sulfonate/bicarbonate transport system permease component